MLKRDELTDPMSCLNRAADDEPLFILRASDICSPATILFWCINRITYGRNLDSDKQISEAQDLAMRMVKWRANQGQRK